MDSAEQDSACKGLLAVKAEAGAQFDIQVPDLSSATKDGEEKLRLSDAFELLLSEHGTQPAVRIGDQCPQCAKTFTANMGPSQRSDHYHTCKGRAIEAYLENAFFAHICKTGCPVVGCTKKWTTDRGSMRTVTQHMYQFHRDTEVCGFKTVDNQSCAFAVGSTDTDSMDAAMLAIHRETAHGWPGRVNRSVHFDPEEGRHVVGLSEIQLHCAAKLPADGDTHKTTTAKYTPAKCPICFLDPAVAPLHRHEDFKGSNNVKWLLEASHACILEA
ncbi:unnamed protein product [Parajaminaea phylloscopi]